MTLKQRIEVWTFGAILIVVLPAIIFATQRLAG